MSTTGPDQTAVTVPPRLLHKLRLLLKCGGAVFAGDANMFPSTSRPADHIDAPGITKNGFDLDVINSALRRDTIPIPHPDNRERYAAHSDFWYWMSGYKTAQMIAETAARHGIKGGHIYDFGGSTGRVFRHFGIQSEDWDVWSSDFKPTSVQWNQENYPRKFGVFLNNAAPHLPLSDGYFDLIIAMSVFTHMNENETGWLLELRRILRPSGVAMFTIHDEETWKAGVALEQRKKFRPDIAMLPDLPDGRTVITFRNDDPYNCQTFHSRSWIREQWGRYFEVLDVVPNATGQQAMVILRRTS